MPTDAPATSTTRTRRRGAIWLVGGVVVGTVGSGLASGNPFFSTMPAGLVAGAGAIAVLAVWKRPTA